MFEKHLIEKVPGKLVLSQVREHSDPLHLGREGHEHLEEDDAERVDVHLVAVLLPPPLLGAHVQLRADLVGVLRRRTVAAAAGLATELRVAIRRYETKVPDL